MGHLVSQFPGANCHPRFLVIKLEDIKDIKIQVLRRRFREEHWLIWKKIEEDYGNLYLGEDSKKKVMGTRI